MNGFGFPVTSPEYQEVKAGNVFDGNYVALNEEQGIRAHGDSTAWRDMVMDIFGRRLSSTTGRVDYDWNENAIKFQSGGSITNSADRVGGNQQINHEFRVGSGITFKPHIHWFQEVVSNTVKPYVLTARYRLQRNNYAKTTAWTTVTCDVGSGGDDIFDFTGEADGFYNQLSRFPDITIDCSVSDTVQIQMTRTDSESGDMLVYFMDIHGEVDSLGSDAEIAKS